MRKQILKAIETSNLYDVVIRSPLDHLPVLSKQLKNTIHLKREDLQSVHSFKIRGAYNKMLKLTESEKAKGVIASSAGNHAQGVALSAKKLGINAVIVMPATTPDIKVNAVTGYGAKVILHGDTYDDAFSHAKSIAKKEKRTFIHPFDDIDVISGQGTIAKEILDALKDAPDYIFVAVGGGGLITGIGTYIKEKSPKTKIIGVEPENAASMTEALIHNKRVILDEVGIFEDGVAVKQVGENTFKLAKQVVDGMITVSADETCAAIKDIFEETRAVAEPAGALSIAGMKKYVKRHRISKKSIVTINCGANINFDRLRHIAERAEIGEEKEALFAVTIPEKTGSFKAFCKFIGKRAVTEFNYRYSDDSDAHIFVGLGISKGKDEANKIYKKLSSKYKTVNLTDNELAKLHIRHMVGGRNRTIKNERLYRFKFPERPGALLEFLNAMSETWNISLFHYRNHGAAFGRVLVGIQVDKNEEKKFASFLKKIGYRFTDETSNPAYRLFL